MAPSNSDAAGGPLPTTSSPGRHHHHHHPPSPLEPVSGKLLFEQECRRRDALRARGPLATGCGEVDERALGGGGFERGCVVGVSAGKAAAGGGGDEEGEVGEMALVMGLQTIARMLVDAWQRGRVEVGRRRRRRRLPRAMIISTAGVATLVGVLRDVLGAQIAGLGALVEGGEEGRKRLARELLGRIAISRVFDVPGLWEALGELDSLPPSQGLGEEVEMTSGGAEEDDAVLEDVARAEVFEDTNLPDATPEQLYDEDDGPQEEGTAPRATSTRQGDATSPRAGGMWSSSPLSDPPSSLPDEAPWETPDMAGESALPQRPTPPGQREEIQDSEQEDEGLLSSPMVPNMTPPEASPVKVAQSGTEEGCLSPVAPGDEEVTMQGQHDIAHQEEEREAALGELPASQAAKAQKDGVPFVDNPADSQDSKHPDIILITHMSTLLSSLFHQREKSSAHEMLQLLASHLRYLSRAPEHGGPLIMILNSTSASLDTTALEPPTTAAMSNQQARDGALPHGPPPGAPPTPGRRPLDPTLRSIFNPPPPPASGLLSYAYHHDTPHARRHKPSFGLVFSQLLDVHLLCTQVPRARGDAEEALYALEKRMAVRVNYEWVVEVLLDEIGVWEGSEAVVEGRRRRSREQRWGAVAVRREAGGVRMVDAFEKKGVEGDVRVALAGGFGGRRV